MGKRHGLIKHPLHRSWANMKTRCSNKKVHNYKWYGGKGITVCSEWQKFCAFYEWAMKNGWKEGLSLERLDNDRNYCPSNCTFIPRKHQQKNQSSNIRLTAFGKTQIISDWSRERGLPYEALRGRLKRGWSHEATVGLPLWAFKSGPKPTKP